ncbi:asparagine synthase-related protein [Thermosynechococcaceae cyanobacterium BACA0444]|uniref:asparagine synthase (glutamine-hydrolyzing) n=1 Tax=Pseudocalidococcus azoricus BACA0444 TaxID=2918990 RepID=A0AAE4FT53_9CYAN|nr:asparagine synthase-related protein [Pseudocalidococcus azoricus]MDS3861859.1 asparagine synthase-related protein [Pseudocalidococcus azoricus BACA0444]
MSSIFGIIHHQAALNPEYLGRMQTSMAYWGQDGSGLWSENQVGLGHLLRHNTPESVYEVLPRVRARGLVITATARIDNRIELCQLLNIAPLEQGMTPDSELIIQAYEKWGLACVDRLLGSWAVAIWHPEQEKLWIARDACGTGGLYYTQQGGLFAFASSLKGILALPPVSRQPNLLEVAHVLTAWPSDGVQTCYENIFHLPPGHTLTLTQGELNIQRYWDVDDIQPLELSSSQAYLDAFLEVYTQAVTSHLRSFKPVGATMSGGLDSGSVCALAAKQLREQHQNLPVFTHVPLYDTQGITHPRRFGDESPFVEANRQFIGNVEVHYLRSEGITPLASLEQKLWINEQPSHAAANFFWMIDLLQTVQNMGLGTVLTGQGGNSTISWGGLPASWRTHLKEGNWDVLWSKVQRARVSPQQTLIRFLPKFLRPRPLRPTSSGLVWLDYSAINPAWAKSFQIDQKMAASGHDPTFQQSDLLAERRDLIRHTSQKANTLWQEMGAAYSVEVRDPTLDKRVIEFCLGIPTSVYRDRHLNRALIRQAMVGVLPDKVRLNQAKGLQAADIAFRVRDHQGEIANALHQLSASPLAQEMLDLPKMHQVLASIQAGITQANSGDCGTILLRGLGCGLFLASFT